MMNTKYEKLEEKLNQYSLDEKIHLAVYLDGSDRFPDQEHSFSGTKEEIDIWIHDEISKCPESVLFTYPSIGPVTVKDELQTRYHEYLDEEEIDNLDYEAFANAGPCGVQKELVEIVKKYGLDQHIYGYFSGRRYIIRDDEDYGDTESVVDYFVDGNLTSVEKSFVASVKMYTYLIEDYYYDRYGGKVKVFGEKELEEKVEVVDR